MASFYKEQAGFPAPHSNNSDNNTCVFIAPFLPGAPVIGLTLLVSLANLLPNTIIPFITVHYKERKTI